MDAIYEAPDACPSDQQLLLSANAVYRSGDEAAVARAQELVTEHMAAHPRLVRVDAV